jgi:hypothetical protein
MPTLCPPRETKRNETEMGEIDLEAPFRFIRFFRFSVSPYLIAVGARGHEKTAAFRRASYY